MLYIYIKMHIKLYEWKLEIPIKWFYNGNLNYKINVSTRNSGSSITYIILKKPFKMLLDQAILLLWSFKVSRKGNFHAVLGISENKKLPTLLQGANVCLITETKNIMHIRKPTNNLSYRYQNFT